MRDLVDDIVLVSEDEMKQTIVLLLEKVHTIAEGAGAASTAAAIQLKDRLQGQTVVCVVSGGNLPLSTLQRIIAEMRPSMREASIGTACASADTSIHALGTPSRCSGQMEATSHGQGGFHYGES
jgi:threonine dehydratase